MLRLHRRRRVELRFKLIPRLAKITSTTTADSRRGAGGGGCRGRGAALDRAWGHWNGRGNRQDRRRGRCWRASDCRSCSGGRGNGGSAWDRILTGHFHGCRRQARKSAIHAARLHRHHGQAWDIGQDRRQLSTGAEADVHADESRHVGYKVDLVLMLLDRVEDVVVAAADWRGM